MSLDPWPADRCPACLEVLSTELDPSTRLCLNCRHEWVPAETSGPLAESSIAVVVPPAPALRAVPDPTPTDDIAAQVARARASMVGHEAVVYEFEAVGLVIAITDDGYAWIEFGSGFSIACLPDEFSMIADDELPDEVIAAIGTTDIMVAAQVIRAGAEAINAEEPEWKLTMAPDGWLPPDAEMMPVIEHGASYAVAYLAIQYRIPPEQLSDIATMLEEAATAAKGTPTP